MTTEDAKELPSRLKQARLLRAMTLEAVAEALDSSFTTIWRYEAGQRRPSGSTLYALAELYGKPVEWFFGKEDSTDDIDIEDPDLRIFFRGEWDEFTEREKEFIRDAIRDARAYLKKRNEMMGRPDDRS